MSTIYGYCRISTARQSSEFISTYLKRCYIKINSFIVTKIRIGLSSFIVGKSKTNYAAKAALQWEVSMIGL